MRETAEGFVSKSGVLMQATCIKCGVLVGWEDETRELGVEFDGMPHKCKGKPFRSVTKKDLNAFSKGAI